MTEPPASSDEETPRRERTHRTLKLMPGGKEGDGHPISAQEARRARGRREPFEVHYTPGPTGVPTWTVGSVSGHAYRVMLPAHPDRAGAQCTCPDFVTRGLGTCKHLEATLARIATTPPAELARLGTAAGPPGLSWATVEAAQHRAFDGLPTGPPVDLARWSRALRRVGRLLYADG